MGFIDIVLSPINSIFDPFIKIGEAIMNIIQLLFHILKIVPKLFDLFTMLLDPIKILKDIFFGIVTGFTMIFNAIIDSLFGNIRQTLNPHLPDSTSDTKRNNGNGICAKPTLLTYILLILCPPLAVFTQRGLAGFYQVIIASVLTLIFYFPGLIYATLILF